MIGVTGYELAEAYPVKGGLWLEVEMYYVAQYIFYDV